MCLEPLGFAHQIPVLQREMQTAKTEVLLAHPKPEKKKVGKTLKSRLSYPGTGEVFVRKYDLYKN